MEDLIANEPVIITISEDDYIKRMPIDTFREQRRGGQGITGIGLKREEDAIKGLYVASTHDYLLIFTNFGRCYWLKVWQIPEAGRKAKGKPLINLLEDLRPDEKIATTLRVANFEDQACILMATRKGVIKKTELIDFSNPRSKGIWAINLDEGDEVIATRLVKPGQQVMLFTYHGMAVRFDEANVRPMGRMARGVKGVNLRAQDDNVVSCEVVNGNETVLVVCENGFGKRSNVEDFRQTNRGGVGVRSIITSERNGNVVGALFVTDDDGLVMISSQGQTVRIRMKELRVMGRNTQGVRLVNLKEGDYLVAIQKLENSEQDEVNIEIPAEGSVASIPKASSEEVELDNVEIEAPEEEEKQDE
jgi:DNA gyrase subunit A